ncbi:hypothetical protein BD309DRAFT_655209 [Dichomitus squalens]|nr:hypothetical protein BD309DRAFT_655209 [Dichomitus squalens]
MTNRCLRRHHQPLGAADGARARLTGMELGHRSGSICTTKATSKIAPNNPQMSSAAKRKDHRGRMWGGWLYMVLREKARNRTSGRREGLKNKSRTIPASIPDRGTPASAHSPHVNRLASPGAALPRRRDPLRQTAEEGNVRK